jgi:WD40 repeat protein
VIQGEETLTGGTADNVAISSLGEIRLAPEVTELAETTEPYVWSLAVAGDTTYVGTGNGGRIYQIDDAGEASVLVDTPEVAILSLTVGPDGDLYAGTSPDGIIYRIDLDAAMPTPTTVFREDEKYVWAMVFDHEGRLYAATGENGKLFRLTPDAEGAGYTSELMFDAEESHLLCLANVGGKVYAGSDSNGLVYRIDPAVDGKAFVVYDSDEKEVRSILNGGLGTVYVTTTTGQVPRPQSPGSPPPQSNGDDVESYLYSIDAKDVARPIWQSDEGVILSAAWMGDAVLVGVGDEGKLYSIAPDGRSEALGSVSDANVLAIVRRGDGFALGTGNAGKVYTLDGSVADEGTWESEAFDAEFVSDWGRLEWEGYSPTDGGISIQSRSGNTATPDNTWAEWADLDAESGKVASPRARFLQVKASLKAGAAGRSPALWSITTAYLQSNLAPEIASASVVVDQDEGGRNGNGAGHPQTKRSAKWEAEDPNGDGLLFAVYFRAEGEGEWHLLEEELTESSHTWDSAPMPDGDYRVRVVASDILANPVERALTTEFVTEPFRIDNTQPTISGLAATRDAAGSVRVTFAAEDATSQIGDAAYSLDADRWHVVHPTDELFDDVSEAFDFTIKDASANAHSVAIKVTDKAGVMTTARVWVAE